MKMSFTKNSLIFPSNFIISCSPNTINIGTILSPRFNKKRQISVITSVMQFAHSDRKLRKVKIKMAIIIIYDLNIILLLFAKWKK